MRARNRRTQMRVFIDENGNCRRSEVTDDRPASGEGDSRGRGDSSASSTAAGSSDDDGSTVDNKQSRGLRGRVLGRSKSGRGSKPAPTPSYQDEEDESKDTDIDIAETDDEDEDNEDVHGEEESLEKEPVPMKTGDYHIHVHIIELRDLQNQKGKENPCDPVVSVEVLGEKQHTPKITADNNPTVNHAMVFGSHHIQADEMEKEAVTITVYNAARVPGFRQFEVGSFALDLATLYQKPDHEMHRQWVAIAREDFRGPSGYLKCSIVVQGPGDPIPDHDLAEDLRKERSEIGISGCLMPPQLSQVLQLLVVTVYRAEGLPQLDSNLVRSGGGIDAYVRVEFAGATQRAGKRGAKTRHQTARTRTKDGTLSVTFNEQVVLPVVVPSMANEVHLSVWDHDLASADDLLCYADPIKFSELDFKPGFDGESDKRSRLIKKFNEDTVGKGRNSPTPTGSRRRRSLVERHTGDAAWGSVLEFTGTKPFWINLYGPPPSSSVLGGESDASKHMRRVSRDASRYQGRILVSCHKEGDAEGQKGGVLEALGGVLSHAPNSKSKWGKGVRGASLKPHRRPVPALLDDIETHFGDAGNVGVAGGSDADPALQLQRAPPTASYALRAIVVRGTLLPVFRRRLRSGPSPLGIEIHLGPDGKKLWTVDMKAPAPDGSVEWSEMLNCDIPVPAVTDDATDGGFTGLPDDVKHVPDIFIYLVKGQKRKRVCYARLKATDLLKNSEQAGAPLAWQQLTADPVIGKVKKRHYAGAVLMHVALQKQSALPQPQRDLSVWQSAFKASKVKRHFRLDVHVFQARRLPAADDDGSIDPYFKLRYGAEEHRLPTHRQNTMAVGCGPEIGGFGGSKKGHFDNTTEPLIYETATFSLGPDGGELMLPRKKDECGDLLMEVWDHDFPDADDEVGFVRIPLKHARLLETGQVYPSMRSLRKETHWWRISETRAAMPGVPVRSNESLRKLKQLQKVVDTCQKEYDDLPDKDKKMKKQEDKSSKVRKVEEALKKAKHDLRRERRDGEVEEEDHSSGEILVAVVMVEIGASGTSPPDPGPEWIKNEIMSTATDKFVEIMALGCRDLRPKGVLPPLMPQVEVSIPRPPEKEQRQRRKPKSGPAAALASRQLEVVSTRPSNDPSSRAPSYSQRLVLPFREPRDAIFAPTLSFVVRDKKPGVGTLFGMRVLGRASFDLVRRLKTDGANVNPEYEGDPFEDIAANVGGADDEDESKHPMGGWHISRKSDRKHVESCLLPGGVKSNDGEIVPAGPVDSDSADEDGDLFAPPMPYLHGRHRLGRHHPGTSEETINTGRLEDTANLNPPPFVTLDLYDGQGKHRKKVGIFKCTIKIVDENGLSAPDDGGTDAGKDSGGISNSISLLKPGKTEQVHVRLYVLQGIQLMPMDDNGYSDPYLKIKLGNKVYYDGSKKKPRQVFEKNRNPEFHAFIDFVAKLPGPSEMHIELWDWDRFSSDDLIGTTTINLEDRWFDKRWQALDSRTEAEKEYFEQLDANAKEASKEAVKKLQNGGNTDYDALEKGEGQQEEGMLEIESHDGGPPPSSSFNCPTKPLERRELFTPVSSCSQGELTMWLDLLSDDQAKRAPPHRIELPPPEEFELRLVIWKARGVKYGDDEGKSDMFARVWLGAAGPKNPKHDTDTHWRAGDHKAAWNWRMKFPLMLPPPASGAEGAYRLTIQLWDADVVSSNEMLAQASFDLTDDKSLPPKQGRNSGAKPPKSFHGHNFMVAISNRDNPVQLFGPRLQTEKEKLKAQKKQKRMQQQAMASSPADVVAPQGALSKGSNAKSPSSPSHYMEMDENSEKALKEPLLSGSNTQAQTPTSAERSRMINRGAQSSGGRLRTPHVFRQAKGASKELSKSKKQRHKDKAKRDHKKRLTDRIKTALGLTTPQDSRWINLTDPVTRKHGGEVLISLELLSKNKATSKPAGIGREAPNSNPTLPEPEGRIKISGLANPLYALKTLMSPKLVYEMMCCCCLLFGFIVWIQVLPAVSGIITILDKLPKRTEHDFAVLIGSAVLLCCTCCCYVGCRSYFMADDDGDSEPESDTESDDDGKRSYEMTKRN